MTGPASASRGAFFVVVKGRVQGVGFRYSAREEGRRLGLDGWVRNAEDGSVEVLVEGPAERLDRFVRWLRQGPPGAGVESAELTERRPTGQRTGFDVTF